jgi:hypothetical protein
MSAALTISSSPSLALPAGAMFHPKMLTIGASTDRAEYQQLGAGISKIDDAGKIWVCDWALWGLRKFGQEDGLELAHAATGYTKGTLKKLAYIAERFAPEHRPDGFTRAHFKALLPFPQDWLNTLLPTVSNRRLSASGIRALAQEAFGSDPSLRPTRKTRAVSIPSALYTRLAEVSPTRKVCVLVEAVLDAWLSKPPEEQASALAVAAESKRERKNERQRNRTKKQKAEEPGTADVRYQLKLYEAAQKAAREAQKAPVGDRRTEGNDFQSAQPHPETSATTDIPRPDYETRRKQQIEAGAQPIPAKERKYTSSVKIVFTACRGNSYIESKEGQMSRFSAAARADRFFTLEKAEAAALEYSADRGYTVFAALCANCSTSHKPVWHVFRERPVSLGGQEKAHLLSQ